MGKYVRPFLFLALILIGCGRETVINTAKVQELKLNNKIDSYVHQVMKLHGIPGMAVAVIGKEGLIHRGNYGKASMETGEMITDSTVFKIFSLTKTIVATSVFKLIEEGKLSLDDKLTEHFEGLPEPWKIVTIANLLSHSSGLPDIHKYGKELGDDSINDEEFIALLYGDAMDFKTGEEWRYNQTNYILLKMLIEKVTDTSFETVIRQHQFAKADPAGVFFMSDTSRIIPNAANYYDFDGTLNSFKKKTEHSGSKNHPLAGLNITLDAYIAWNNRLDNDVLITETTKNSMWQPYSFTNTDRNFLHGWDVYKVNGHDSFGFSGGGVSGLRKFLDQDLAIIVLTTGYRYYAVQDMIIDHIAGMANADLVDKDMDLKEFLTAEYLLSGDSTAISDMVTRAKIEYPDYHLQAIFKSLGYRLFFDLNRKQDAIQLFEYNVMEYPDSYDTHGSLAYLQFLTDAFEDSRKNYIRARKLNPDNTYSERMIKRIDAIMGKK